MAVRKHTAIPATLSLLSMDERFGKTVQHWTRPISTLPPFFKNHTSPTPRQNPYQLPSRARIEAYYGYNVRSEGVWDKGSNGARTPMKATRGQGREVGGSQPCNFLLEPPKGGKGIKLEQVFEQSFL